MGLDTSQTHLKPFTISSEEYNCSVRIVNVKKQAQLSSLYPSFFAWQHNS